MSITAPVRVLHIIGGLGGGGSERLLWDAVRLSDPSRVRHRVVTVYPDNGRFVYAPRLAAMGAHVPRRSLWHQSWSSHPLGRAANRLWGRLPARQREQCYPLWQLGVILPTALARVGEECVRFRPHLVHGHTFHGFAFGLLLRYGLGLPLVHSMPCLFSQMAAAGHAWMPRVYAWLQAGVTQYFTNYPDELLAIGVAPERILPYRGLVDVEALERAREARPRHRTEVRRALGIPPEAPIALSVGRLDPSKGHQYALEALPRLLAHCPALHWVVLGEGAQLLALAKRARALGVDEHVHLPGFIEDPLPWYAAADIYLHTAVYEADNLSSFQAIGLGLPVVGFDTGSQTALIPSVGHGWLVPNRDPAALAQRVAAALALPDRGRGIGALGAAYCAANLDLRLHVEDLTGAYESLRAARMARTTRRLATAWSTSHASKSLASRGDGCRAGNPSRESSTSRHGGARATRAHALWSTVPPEQE